MKLLIRTLLNDCNYADLCVYCIFYVVVTVLEIENTSKDKFVKCYIHPTQSHRVTSEVVSISKTSMYVQIYK